MDVKRIGGLEGLFIVMPFLYVNTFNHTSAPSTEILRSVCKTYRERRRFLASTCAGKEINPAYPLIPRIPVQTRWQQKNKMHKAQPHHSIYLQTHFRTRLSLELRAGSFREKKGAGWKKRV